MLFGLVIGGMHSPAGAIVGGLFLQFFPDLVAGLGKGLSALLYAVLLIAAMVLMPTGIVGALEEVIHLPRLTGRPGGGEPHQIREGEDHDLLPGSASTEAFPLPASAVRRGS